MALDAGMLANLTDGVAACVGYIGTGTTIMTGGVFAIGVAFLMVKGGVRTVVRVLTSIVH